MQERLERDTAKEDLRGEAGREQLREARQRIARAYDRTSRAASRWYDDALSYGRENPATAVLVAFGAGLGLGALLFMDRKPPYRQRVMPALAMAVGDVVREVFDVRR
jgi:ElaB/YqjD/DUF883 family membrane-anchored ribosome-binding protein